MFVLSFEVSLYVMLTYMFSLPLSGAYSHWGIETSQDQMFNSLKSEIGQTGWRYTKTRRLHVFK